MKPPADAPGTPAGRGRASALGDRRGEVGCAAKVRAPFGVLGLATNRDALTVLTVLPTAESESAPADAVSEQAARELARYFADPDFRFTVPLAPRGTPYQQRVWTALSAIPRGEARTYGDLARALASAARAVGQACGANPIALIVPCHRVVGAQGALGGFMHAAAGDPIAVKRWLLAHEGARTGT
jgi:methylated-DNA-[protein]-cysteine S-methyltransferase